MHFELANALEVLSSTPPTLRSWLSGLSEAWTETRGDRDDWQPFDVVGHLINCEYTDWVPRARSILEGDGVFPPFDRYAHFEQSRGKTLAQLLDEFEAARNASLETLAGWKLTSDQLRLQGVHREFGNVTLSQLLATWAVHDLTHIRQIATAMAKRYELAVGPWKAYLSMFR